MTKRTLGWNALRPNRRACALALIVVSLVLSPRTSGQQGETVRFAAIGDFGKAGSGELDVANLVKSWTPDFILALGDNNYELGEASTIDANIGQYYHDYISPYHGSYGASGATNRFFPALGNHDWGDGYIWPPTVQPHLDYFTLPNNERYYDIVKGPVHLFAVDSDYHEPDGNSATSVQATWLQSRLAASTSPWKIVYFHHTPYSSGTRSPDLTMRWPFREWGATAVIAAHHHDYEAFTIENTPYFVSGLGGNGSNTFSFPTPGSRVRYRSTLGAMRITATAAQITFEFVATTGAVIDTYSIDAPSGAGAPNNLVATSAPIGRVDLWWTDNSTAETGFSIERSDDGSTFNNIATVGSNVTGFTDLAVNSIPTTYQYRVCALVDAGCTTYSNTAVTQTVPAQPDAPVLAAAPASTSSVRLTWNTVAGATGFNVYRLVSGVFTSIGSTAENITEFLDTARTPATSYTYVVRSFNAGGESVSSNEATATTGQLAAPTNLTAVAVSSSQINLAWTDNSVGENYFKVLRSTDGVNFSVVAWPAANSTTYADTGRAAGTTYYYKVQAYENGGGVSDYSNIAVATTLSPLAAPSGLTATAISASRIDLSWTDNSSTEDGFRIYRSTNGTTFSQVATVGANVTTYQNAGLIASTTYYYRVTGYSSGGGESAASNVANATTASVPSAPSGLAAVAVSSSQINLTWTDNSSNEDGFRIDRSLDGVNFGNLVWLGSNVTSYSNTGLPAATKYYYRVVAYNANGTSNASNVANATTLSALTPPSGLSAMAASSSKIVLAWTDNSGSESGFRVYRSTDGNTFTQIATVGSNVQTYSNSNLTPSTTYYYQVTAYETNGAQSPPSNTANATTYANPTPPTNLTAVAVSSTQINLSWTDNSSNETNFKIERSTNGVSFSTLSWVGANVTTYSNTKLKPSTTYYYRVSAYNSTIGTSTPSSVASATTLPR